MSIKGIKPLTHAYQQLEAIDKAKGEKKIELLKQYGAVAPLNFMLSLNYDQTLILELPAGMAPFERNEATHEDFMGSLAQQAKRLRVCFVQSTYKKHEKERTFLQICESIPVKEAEMLCFVKDKALTEMYPTVTKELVASVFPGYVREKK